MPQLLVLGVLRPIGGVEEELEWLLYGQCFYVYRPGCVGFISQSDFDITVSPKRDVVVQKSAQPGLSVLQFLVARKEGPDGQV